MDTFKLDVQEIVTIVNKVYDENKAYCFGVNRAFDREDAEVFEAKVIESSGDVYDLIDDIAFKSKDLYENFSFLVIATAGWAKPIEKGEEDIMPSVHPERRRVYLYNVVAKNRDIASALVFDGDIDSIIIDTEKEASGPLMESLLTI